MSCNEWYSVVMSLLSVNRVWRSDRSGHEMTGTDVDDTVDSMDVMDMTLTLICLG